MFDKHKLFCAVLLALLCAAGCGREAEPSGSVAAVVNGEPVSLRLLEAVQDFGSVDLGAARQDSLESLKKQYGHSLAALIVRVLIRQELKKAGLEPDESRLAALEADIRRDYDDEFEKELTEDNISLDIWRELMRLQLAMDVFADEFLRSRAYVPLAEMESFYEAHQSRFKTPRALRLTHVSGAEQAVVASARADYLKKKPAALKDERLTAVSVSMREESVLKEWRKEVLALSPGQATTVRSYGGLHHFVILEGVRPARALSLLEAYPLVESILMEEKIALEFEAWLERTVPSARIKIAAGLAPVLGRERSRP